MSRWRSLARQVVSMIDRAVEAGCQGAYAFLAPDSSISVGLRVTLASPQGRLRADHPSWRGPRTLNPLHPGSRRPPGSGPLRGASGVTTRCIATTPAARPANRCVAGSQRYFKGKSEWSSPLAGAIVLVAGMAGHQT